jgi:acyl-CoA reductase-like NAD-dependent aldehyde dehydrogenase
MTEHPIPRGVSFTGSIATGKKVNVAAAADLKRVLLELGGNDAAIVLPDADPADVAEKLFWPAFRNSGQICMAVKRVFVPEELRAAEVAEKLEAGTVWVNTHMQLTHDAPFTGMKHSGLGSEMGLYSIHAYTDPQTVYRTRFQVIKKGAGEAPEAW